MASAQGTTTIDFGAFPGKSDSFVDVAGQAGIQASSLVEAWLYPTATADHTDDEHLLVPMKVVAGGVIAGAGFRIWGLNMEQVIERAGPELDRQSPGVGRDRLGPGRGAAGRNPAGYGADGVNRGGLIWGLWSVAWVWSD